jgi:hypothetical protein
MQTLHSPNTFGYTQVQLLSTNLTNGAATSAAIARPNGVFLVSVTGVLSAVAGSIVGMVLEGTVDGTNWYTVAQMDVADYMTTAADQYVINFGSGGWASVGRYTHLRVRTVDTGVGPNTYTLAVGVGGVMHDGQGAVQQIAVVRGGVVTNSTAFGRPKGVRQVTIAGSIPTVVLDGVTRFGIRIQGSADGGTTWADLNQSVFITAAAQPHILGMGGSMCVDLGGMSQIRIQMYDNGGMAGVTTNYSGTFFIGYDTGDWAAFETPSASGGGDSSLLSAKVDIPDATAVAPADASIVVQVTDSSGAPLAGIHNLVLVISDTLNAGDVDLAGVVQFNGISGGGVGTMVAGDNTNRCAVRTDATGLVNVEINDNGAGASTVYVHAESAGVPHPVGVGMAVAQSDQCTVIFT